MCSFFKILLREQLQNGCRKNDVRLYIAQKAVMTLIKEQMEGRCEKLVNLYRRLLSPIVFIVCRRLSGCVKSLINYSAFCSTNSFLLYFPASGIDDKECAECPFSYMEVTFRVITSEWNPAAGWRK